MVQVAVLAYMLALPPGGSVCKAWEPEDGNWRYGRRVAISLNQLVNTIFGGQPDETLSSRAGRNRDRSRLARWTCVVLDRLDPCHCEGSVELGADGRPQPHQLYLAPPRLPLRRVPYLRPL